MAPVLAESAARGVPFAIEHTNSLRVDVGFVHTLADAIDLARRLGTGVCMEINACWAERDLAATVRAGVDTLRLVQVSDFAVGTLSTPNRLVPGDGDIPLARILGDVLDAGYAGCFDLELIGPAIDAEGYETAVPPSRVDRDRRPLPAGARPAPSRAARTGPAARRGSGGMTRPSAAAIASQ